MDRKNDEFVMDTFEYAEYVRGQHLLTLIVAAADSEEKVAFEFLIEKAKEYVEGL